MNATTWAPVAPQDRYRISAGPASTTTSELHSVASPTTGAQAAAQPWNPANPLFWFAGIAAVTFGLMAVSTTVRVGKATGSVSLGSTK